MKISGSHILVTGAAKRVGRVIAEALLDQRVKLTGHYHQSHNEIESLVSVARSKNSELFTVSADLKDHSQIERAVGLAEKHFGPVDVLINCASRFYPTPALECSEGQWDDLQATNLRGQFFFAQACARNMIKLGGVILNIVDAQGERPMRKFVAYTVSKAGLLMLTRQLALEWAPKIRVNSISPGPVLVPDGYSEVLVQKSAERTLLKRWGTPQDIANAALFLIQNDYITGLNLAVDGGRSLS